MAFRQTKSNVDYGLSNALQVLPFGTIQAKRDPATTDRATLGRSWINKLTGSYWYLSTINAGVYTWLQLTSGGSTGVFTSLSVTPGPVTLVGTTNINTTGTAVTNIGNTTGNTFVTGALSATTTLTAGTGITATTGNLTATNGNLVLGTAGNKINIATGANASIGTSAAMIGGTVTISTNKVTASSIIFVSRKTIGGTAGNLSIANVVANTSFDIISDSGTETSTINWWLVN